MAALKRISRGALAAVALAAGLAAVPAAAQPYGGQHGFMHLEAIKSQLNLDTYQQGLWDTAAAAGKSARESAHASRATVRQAIADEAAKPAGFAPDLAKIAAASDKAHDVNTATRRAVRDRWLELYATFKPEQVAVVKTVLAKRLERMDSFRERMQQRFGRP